MTLRMGHKYECVLCGRGFDSDGGCKYIVSIVQTGGRGHHSYARTLAVCGHCLRTRRNIMLLQPRRGGSDNILDFHVARRGRGKGCE